MSCRCCCQKNFQYDRLPSVMNGQYSDDWFFNMKECRQHNSGIGGQAVLEGVMMRNKDKYAIAVRKSDGSIIVKEETYKGILAGSPLKKIPFVRGIFVFIDSMILGLRCTDYSATIYAEDDPDAEPDEKTIDSITEATQNAAAADKADRSGSEKEKRARKNPLKNRRRRNLWVRGS